MTSSHTLRNLRNHSHNHKNNNTNISHRSSMCNLQLNKHSHSKHSHSKHLSI
ncbi:hypothetical protein GQ42DRAFT_162965 [Ramicandelaber brevisporus]|nr:hypothetical protein GQ42DRAFT_163981 [Ramicandelaber brevisporus]KAI8870127.1 hypothetical protein GQ42DRAFT_162965 [Ramicandelaber brevisporus]